MVSDIITPGETPPGSHGLTDVAGCISILALRTTEASLLSASTVSVALRPALHKFLNLVTKLSSSLRAMVRVSYLSQMIPLSD